ncbi:MAG: T9SS type A sorting domain-containing protein [Flavobacteriales bacterium]|nr:T9SS type A sorting domain-containing protein [Flavobacteriales bacterium]
MKARLLFTAALLGIQVCAMAQCSEPATIRILTVGDSWSVFMNANSTFNNSLRKWGHSDKRYFTNLIISENGSETDDFLQSVKQDEIAAQLAANPSIDVVHLSIGGNDVLGDWNVNWTQDQVDSLEAEVTLRLTSIIDFIKSVKPGIRIVWSGYTYPNFGEVIGSLPEAAWSTHPFYDTWQSMGFPDFLQINTILNSFSATVEEYAATDPQVDFVYCPGILQHVYGQPTALPVAPGGTYQPFEAPLPVGFPEYPTPRPGMNNYGFFTDAFHLSAGGYSAFIDYQVQKFYHKYFMDDQYILATDNASTGGVSSGGTVTAAPMVGESGGVEYAAVLNFETTAMPDTGVSKAEIFMRRESQLGNNLYTTPMQVRITRGSFGADVTVMAEDFAAVGEAAGPPCTFGSNGGDGHWVRLQLPEELLPYINNESDIQLHVTSPEASGRMITYSDALDPDFAPVLNLTYGPKTPASVNDLATTGFRLRAYPNPTTGLLTIDTEGQDILSMEVMDIRGGLVLATSTNSTTLDLVALPSGPYLLHVVTAKGSTWQRVVKQ